MNTKNVLSAGMIMLLVISGASVLAQGRSRSNGHDNNHSNWNGNGNGHHNNGQQHHDNNRPNYLYHDNDHHDRNYHDYHNYHHNDRRVVHVYHPAPVERRVVYHYCHERPRYVYYRDYDVYYDCHRNVYISFGGRNWNISAGIPVVMRHVDVHTIVTTNVDYYDDDFPEYLETRRPGGRLYAEW